MGEEDILLIVGSGSEEKLYRKLINDKGLKNVFIIPHLDKEELFILYDNCELLLFPVINEVWGLVVAEALSRGVPVISTVECNAATQLIINGYNGYILPENNPKMWFRAIDSLKIDQKKMLELRKNAIKTVSGLTIENNAREINRIFEDIQNRNTKYV